MSTIANDLNVLAERYEQIRMDEPNENLSYIGFADFGVLDSEPKWIVMKLQLIGTETKIFYASGYKDRTNVWNDRQSLTYLS
jgi:hypothetical protein